MVGKGKKLKKHKRDEESIIKNKIKEAEDKFWEQIKKAEEDGDVD